MNKRVEVWTYIVTTHNKYFDVAANELVLHGNWVEEVFTSQYYSLLVMQLELETWNGLKKT